MVFDSASSDMPNMAEAAAANAFSYERRNKNSGCPLGDVTKLSNGVLDGLMSVNDHVTGHLFGGHGAKPASIVLSVKVIDGLALSLCGKPFMVANRKARAMVAFLALQRELAVSRERLAGLFWPDVGEQQARTSLRQALFELRASLGQHFERVLIVNRETVAIDRTAVELDLDTMLAELERRAVPPFLLRQEVAGRLLAGWEDLSPLFGEWLSGTRQGAEQQILRALEGGFDNEELSPIVRRGFADACLKLDPTHEAACRALMRMAVAGGESGVALRAYASLYEALGQELDTEPSAATQALIADIKLGLLDPSSPHPLKIGQAALPERDGPRSDPFFGSVPVVAVFPFLTFGPDPMPAYMAESLMEDLVCMLASLREPVALSSSSTRMIRGSEADLNSACRQLGAQYYVTGSIRLAAGTARVSVQLAEAGSGGVLWARPFDIPASSMFEAQDSIAASVAHTLAPRVQEVELRRSRRCRPEDLNAYQLLLQGRELTYRMDPDTYDDALPMLRRAAALDPGFSAIPAALANWYCLRVFQGWSRDREADTGAVLAHARAALRADPGHPRMLALLGHTRMLTARQYDEAAILHRRALDSSPNDSEAWMFSSATYAYMGEGAEAVRRAERAIALSPWDPLLHQYEHYCCIAHYAAGDYAAAATYGLSSFERNPNLVSNLRMTAAALAGLGRQADARDIASHVMGLEPGFAVGPWIVRQAFRDDGQRERYGMHLIEAGLPP